LRGFRGCLVPHDPEPSADQWLINPNWSLRGEYLYYKFTDVANATVAGGAIVPGTFTTHNLGDMSINVFRVAVNYKFDWCR
jgi:opacity protein-like surface antigen